MGIQTQVTDPTGWPAGWWLTEADRPKPVSQGFCVFNGEALA